MTTFTFYTTSGNAGRVDSEDPTYATARSGSSFTTNAFPGIGQGTGYVCQEGFLRFDTSTLGAGATVSSATLSIYGLIDGSTTDFTINARYRDWGSSLETSDWVAGASVSALTLLATLSTVGFSTSGYNAFTSDGAFVSNINVSGFTPIIMASNRFEAGTVPTGSESVTVYGAGSESNAPKLVVEATLPSAFRMFSVF